MEDYEDVDPCTSGINLLKKKKVSVVGMLPRQNVKGGCTICRSLTNHFDAEVSYYFYKLLQLNYSATKKQELPVSENQNALSSTLQEDV